LRFLKNALRPKHQLVVFPLLTQPSTLRRPGGACLRRWRTADAADDQVRSPMGDDEPPPHSIAENGNGFQMDGGEPRSLGTHPGIKEVGVSSDLIPPTPSCSTSSRRYLLEVGSPVGGAAGAQRRLRGGTGEPHAFARHETPDVHRDPADSSSDPRTLGPGRRRLRRSSPRSTKTR